MRNICLSSIVAAFSVFAVAAPGLGIVRSAHADTSPTALYLAEGTTQAGFQEFLTLVNIGEAATATVTYMFGDGSAPLVRVMALGAHSRTTVNVNLAVGPGRDVSIAIDAAGNPSVAAERPLYFAACMGTGLCAQGSHIGAAVAAAPSWYLAEGFTGAGFQEYLTIANPNPVPATAVITYAFNEGANQQQALSIGAMQRATVDVNAVVGRGREVSAQVTATAPIVVERPIYFRSCPGVCAEGGSVSSGTQPRTSFDFAEGAAWNGFQEYLSLMNPGSVDTSASVTYMFGPGQGAPITRAYALAAHSRRTINVKMEAGAFRDVAMHVEAAQAIVAERPQYYNFVAGETPVNGASDAAGMQPATSWLFAEGYTGPGFNEYLSIVNPGTQFANLTVTYLFPDGLPQAQALSVPVHGRITVHVNKAVGAGREVSVRVTADQPVVVERPMYFSGCAVGVCIHVGPPPSPGPPPPPGPKCSIGFGSAEMGAPGSMTEINAVENEIHQHLAIIHFYQGWGPAMQPGVDVTLTAMQETAAHGSVPLVTWEPWNGGGPGANSFPLKQIAAGAYDEYVDSWANGMRSYGGPVMLAFAHEMQGNWYPWGAGINGNTAADYVAAYRHVHDRFTAAKVNNVQWVWTALADPNWPSMEQFYPGDAYTDWLGIDVYNNGTATPWSSWQSLETLLKPAYDRLGTLNGSKPVALVEWASVDKGGDKGAWMVDAAHALPLRFPRVHAAVWFSAGSTDYSIRSSQSAIGSAQAAFGGLPFCANFDPAAH